MEGITSAPTIIESKRGQYVVIGSIDHGMQIPPVAVPKLVSSLKSIQALMMEAPESLHSQMHPMSTEILTKVSAGQVPIHYLSGNDGNEDIGGIVLKYAPQNLAEIFVPCVYVRNTCQMGNSPTFDSVLAFIQLYRGRFRFLDAKKAMTGYGKVLKHWRDNKLDPVDLDLFSYDFEKFVGDVREYELWRPELRHFRARYSGKIAICVGDYHSPFVRDALEGQSIPVPNWNTHLDHLREDHLTPQDPKVLRRIYGELEKALKEQSF